MTDEYEQAQQRLREAAELRKRMADEHQAKLLADEEAEEERELEEEEAEDEKADDTRFMSADAKLTHLPLHWALLTLLVCMGISFLINQVDGENLRKAVNLAHEKGQLSDDEAKTAERGLTTYEQREELRAKFQKVKTRKRERELADKARHILEHSKHEEEEEPSLFETMIERGITGEDVRQWMQDKSGTNWERYRNMATSVALVLGGLGLVVAAFMVRIAGALLFGGIAAVAGFVVGLDPLFIAGLGLVGALVGSFFATRLLLASIYSNAMLAGLMVGGVAGGGGIYLGSGSEGLALLGLGVGALFGAMVALKFARQFYLCSVLANTAGMASFILWLFWGEQFPFFSQVTFGGLMIVDGLLTRLYHKVRYR